MPLTKKTYAKKTFAKKTYPKKTYYPRKPYTTYRPIKPELKGVDRTDTLATITNSSAQSAIALNVIEQGASFYNRVGTRINNVNMTLDVKFKQSANANAVPDWVRCLIVYDKQCNGVAPIASNILLDTDQAGATTTTSMSGINLINRNRFKILCDEKIWLPPTTAAGALQSPDLTNPTSDTFKVSRFIKLRGLTTMYNQVNGGTVADIVSGGVFMLIMCQNASCGWGYDTHSRIKYLDI